MGRRPKYFTSAERASAHHNSDVRYSQTPRYVSSVRIQVSRRCDGGLLRSAKTVRAVTQRSRYLSEATRKHGLHAPKSIPGLAPLPSFIHALCAEPLPEHEPLFQQALASADALDESDLPRWKTEPPFVEDDDNDDPHSDNYTRFTKSLASVLHGVRMREQNVRDALRCAAFKAEGWRAGIDALRMEVVQLLSDWTRVVDLDVYHRYHHPREWEMHRHYIQWQARTIYHLYHLKFLDES
ncbi:hypothetical protein C8R43DRAFT_1131103 [Mycena crocata]|nr:hypothetical protein C8R43DRAFT_1131103 [Mycena crocata]